METFFKIAQVQDGQSSAKQIFRAKLSYRTDGATVDCELTDLECGQRVAMLEAYPRWTESELALFVRLLLRAGPRCLEVPATGRLQVALEVGPYPSLVIEREVLDVQVDRKKLFVTLLSPVRLVAGKQITTERELSVNEAVCSAIAGALAWKRPVPRLPRPLSEVRVRSTERGDEYVRLCEVPPLARHYLRLACHVPPQGEIVEATLWRAFLTRLSS